jgi:hypothetical protein
VDWLVDRFLSMPMQIATSTEGGQIPVTRGALAEIAKDPSMGFLRLKPDELAAMYQIDYTKVDQAAYSQKWNRRIGRR